MKRLKLLVAVVTLLIDLLPAIAMAPEIPPASPSQQVGPNEHKGTAENVQKAPENEKDHSSRFETELIETLRALIDQEKAAEKQRRADEKPWRSPSVWINLGLLLVGFAYTVAAWRQLRVTEGNLIETRKSVDHTIRMERPWIQVVPGPPVGWPTKDHEEYHFRFMWFAKNIGRSPALLTRIDINVELRNFPIPPFPPLYGEPAPIAGFIVPPNGEHQSEGEIVLSRADIAEMFAVKKGIAFYGFIEYLDMGGQSHRTRFFSYWNYTETGRTAFTPIGPGGSIEYT